MVSDINLKAKIAIIGASYLQKPLVEKAKSLGFETHVFAWEQGAVCREIADVFYPISITDIDAIYKECSRIRPLGIITIGSDLATVAVNNIAARLGLVGNSLECTNICTDKFLMRNRLASAGLNCPAYTRVSSRESDLSLSTMEYPLIVKPVDRSGSRGVCRVDNEANLMEAIDNARNESLCGDVIVEAYIEGRELSIETISWRCEHHILQYTDKVTTGAPNFVEMAHHQPALLNHSEKSKVRDTVISALNALGIEYGASHTEIRITDKGEPFIIEVGARMAGDCIGSDLVQLSTGYDFVKGVIEVATGVFHVPVLTKQAFSGIHYILAKPGFLAAIVFKGDNYVARHELLVQMGEYLQAVENSSQRAAFYIYQSDHRLEFDPAQLSLGIQEEMNDSLQ